VNRKTKTTIFVAYFYLPFFCDNSLTPEADGRYENKPNPCTQRSSSIGFVNHCLGLTQSLTQGHYLAFIILASVMA
jgi:hypothetical protein